MESSIEGSGTSAPIAGPTDKVEKTEGDEIQLEPTKDEMERERLISRAEQVKLSLDEGIRALCGM